VKTIELGEKEEISYHEYVRQRFEENQRQNKKMWNQRMKEIQERNKRKEELLRQRKLNLKDFIEERKELRKEKEESVRENLMISQEAKVLLA